MPELKREGVRLFYHVWGTEGPGVVLVHGLGSCGEDWPFQVERWQRHYRLVAPDLRGHGQSAPIRAPVTVADFADDVAAIVQAADVAPAHVVGLSLGGMVAQELALRHPELVRSLVLVNTFCRLRVRGWRDRRRIWARTLALRLLPMSFVARSTARRLFPQPEDAELYRAPVKRLRGNDRRSIWLAWQAIRHHDTCDRLEHVRVPTLVVHGEEDTTVSYVDCQVLAQRIPGAQLKTIPNSGHATPLDAPNRFNMAVEEFWKRVETEAAGGVSAS